MKSLMYIGTGGFLGACVRYAFNLAFNRFSVYLPLGTLVSNVVAGLLIGVIIGFDRQTGFFSPNIKLFLTTGLLGGLSTFSTFSLESVDLFSAGKYTAGVLNIFLNVALSLLGVFIGMAAARQLSFVLAK